MITQCTVGSMPDAGQAKDFVAAGGDDDNNNDIHTVQV